MDRQPRWHALPVLATALVALLLWSPAAARALPGFRAALDPKVFPVAAADYLERTSFAGNVFATDQWSSYLIYREFPRVRVFLDGRTDFYGAQVAASYRDLLTARGAWEQTLEQYGVDAAVLPADSRLATALEESARWKAVYRDSVAVVFNRVANGAAKQSTEVSRWIFPERLVAAASGASADPAGLEELAGTRRAGSGGVHAAAVLPIPLAGDQQPIPATGQRAKIRAGIPEQATCERASPGVSLESRGISALKSSFFLLVSRMLSVRSAEK